MPNLKCNEWLMFVDVQTSNARMVHVCTKPQRGDVFIAGGFNHRKHEIIKISCSEGTT